MSDETRIERLLRRVRNDLAELRFDFALVGGFAVSARAEPRFTRDVDLAIAVTSDQQAEDLVSKLRLRGYEVLALVEQESVGRLAAARLFPPLKKEPGVVLDLLFASSGIEPEIVSDADPIEILDGLEIRVATIAHLIATKILARDDQRRPQDRADLLALLAEASDRDLAAARDAIALIVRRGFGRERDLEGEFREFLREFESL